MESDWLTQLPRPQRQAVESAGYRLVRWTAARAVLQTRVTKGRLPGALGEFLTHWLPAAPANTGGELRLSFGHTEDRTRLKLVGGDGALAISTLEHALLHLPALRPFWRQELRQRHFDALRSLVPQAWLLDPAQIPPGAVIQGLGTPSWEQPGPEWEVRDRTGAARHDWSQALAARDSILSHRPAANVMLHARYERTAPGRVVLRTIEEAAP